MQKRNNQTHRPAEQPTLVNFQDERQRRRPGEQTTREHQRLPMPVRSSSSASASSPLPERSGDTQPPHCACCGRRGGQVKILLEPKQGKPLLCNICLATCCLILKDEEEIVAEYEPEPPLSASPHRQRYYCSFCGKEQAEVARLIAMLNSLFICNECVEASAVIIEQVAAGIVAGTLPMMPTQ